MKFKKIRIKTISYFLIIIFIGSAIVTFISVFNNKTINNVIDDDTNKDDSQFINIAQDFSNKYYIEQITTFQSNTGEYFFDKDLIKENILQIIKSILLYDNEFDDSPDDYNKIVRYLIDSSKKELTINLFLYNKLIKSKRFKSYFKIVIQ